MATLLAVVAGGGSAALAGAVLSAASGLPVDVPILALAAYSGAASGVVVWVCVWLMERLQPTGRLAKTVQYSLAVAAGTLVGFLFAMLTLSVAWGISFTAARSDVDLWVPFLLLMPTVVCSLVASISAAFVVSLVGGSKSIE